MDARRHAPAADRNREPILTILRRVLPVRGLVLEVASGTGQHAAHFAAALPGITWQPSEVDPELLASIAAWTRNLANVRPALELDATSAGWPATGVDAIFNANLIHIAPWPVCLGLLAGAARHLAPGGALVLYGPFRIDGRHTADSNESFDRDLRETDPLWGVRDLDAVCAAAADQGLVLDERTPMPANNQTVVLRRT